MEITYSTGPRYIDGVNIDAGVDAAIAKELKTDIDAPVTGLKGKGYEPGQKNLDGTEL